MSMRHHSCKARKSVQMKRSRRNNTQFRFPSSLIYDDLLRHRDYQKVAIPHKNPQHNNILAFLVGTASETILQKLKKLKKTHTHTHSYQLKSVLKCGVIFPEILVFFFFSIERLVNFHLTTIHSRV